MSGAINYVRGTVRVELRSKYSERVVNICASSGVDFWDLRRGEGGAAEVTVYIPGYLKLREVAEKTGAFTVRVLGRRGAPFFLWRIRRRYVLFAGLIACLAAVAYTSFFVWQIDVVGNEKVPSAAILSALRDAGVDIGVNALKVSQERVSNRVLLEMPELSFISLNTHGCRLEVVVREARERPELFDPAVPTSVFAGKAGIITDMEVLEGWATVAPGDTVGVGDELISSFVPVGNGRNVHAEGRVTARTWYELTLSTPLETVKKRYTGETRRRTAIIFGGKRLNLYFSGGNPYGCYDKITEYETLTLPGGTVLPVTVVRETYDEYERVSEALTAEDAERLLRSRLMYLLEREIGEGSVTDTRFESREEGGLLYVTLRAECLEEIGVAQGVAAEIQLPSP